jgi:hypothetical protein
MDRELGFHIEMETDRLIREEHVPRDEAKRRALATFGGVTQHKEALRDRRGLAWLGGLSLDFKLGFRMLVKYPGLTIVGGVAMAFAMWVGAVVFVVVAQFLRPTLPLPDGDRVVQIRNWDVEAQTVEPRVSNDFAVWRQALTSVTDIGAYRDLSRNLIASAGDSRPIQVAEITASAFRIAPSMPLLGRVLSAADEKAGAAPVILLGYDVWRRRFASDASVIGRSVQLGETFVTVVGLMPEGFAFPVSHDAWAPLASNLLNQPPREGPEITVFGKLAPGVSFEEAQAQLSVLGQRASAQFPVTHKRLQAQVVPFTRLFGIEPSPENTGILFSINVFAVMLLASSAATWPCCSSRGRRLVRPSCWSGAPWARAASGSSRSCSPKRWCSARWRRRSASWPRSSCFNDGERAFSRRIWDDFRFGTI